MIEQNKLLDLLLYAVNEANGWHDDHNGSGIKSPEMAQCVAVLAANGLHPRDYDDGRAFLAGLPPDEPWSSDDIVDFLNSTNEVLRDMHFFGMDEPTHLAGIASKTTIRTGVPGNWRKMYPEVKDGQ